MRSPMPDLNLGKAVSNDDCDALASHVAIAANKTATIAGRTAGATSPLSPNRQHNTGLLLRANSIDVDARVTPLDPPGNPKGAPTGAARLAGAGYQRLRRSVSTSSSPFAKRPARRSNSQPSLG